MKKRVLLSYSTEHLLKKDKVRFFYALNGRNSFKGIMDRTKTQRLGRTVLLVLPEHIEEFRDFLTHWKCRWRELNIILR